MKEIFGDNGEWDLDRLSFTLPDHVIKVKKGIPRQLFNNQADTL